MRCASTVRRELAVHQAADQGKRGPIAQLVERLAGSQKVRGSNPLGSTTRANAGSGSCTPFAHADLVQLDLKHADFGDRFGHVERIRRISGDPNRERHDRAVIAAIGPVLAGVDLDHPRRSPTAAASTRTGPTAGPWRRGVSS